MQKCSLILVLGMIVVLFPSATPPIQAKWGRVTDQEWNLAPPEDYPEAKAVVLSDSGSLGIGYNIVSFRRQVRIKVFDKVGAESVSNIELRFHKDDRLHGFKAHTILPSGEKKRVKEKYEKESGHWKTLTFAFPAVEDGAILEYRYEVYHERFGFLDPWYFDSELYTLRSVFSASVTPKSLSYRATFANVPPAKRNPEKSGYAFFCALDSLPPLRPEPLIGGYASYRRCMYLELAGLVEFLGVTEPGDIWRVMGAGVLQVVSEFVDNQDRVDATANSVCAGAANEEDKIVRLYEFVRDSIETRRDIGQTYWDKDGAGDLLKRRYGTAVEKNTLLVALLQSAGIDACPLMIGTRDYSGFDPDIYSLRQFNHVICCLMTDSSRAAVLDANDRTVAYPHLPARDLVRGGLLVKRGESAAVELKHASRLSGSKHTSKVTITAEGAAICSTYVWVVGYEMSKYEQSLRDSLSTRELAEDWLKQKSDRATLTAVNASCDPAGDSLCLKLAFEIPDFATVIDGNCFLPSFVLPFQNPFTDNKRFFPVDFQYPFFKHYTTDISLPEGMTVADAPPDAGQQIDGGLFVRNVFFSPSSVSISTMLNIEKTVFVPSEYPDLKELFESWKDAETDQIALAASAEEGRE